MTCVETCGHYSEPTHPFTFFAAGTGAAAATAAVYVELSYFIILAVEAVVAALICSDFLRDSWRIHILLLTD